MQSMEFVMINSESAITLKRGGLLRDSREALFEAIYVLVKFYLKYIYLSKPGCRLIFRNFSWKMLEEGLF